MKEELSSKLVEILTSIQAATSKASDFAMEQLPDIAQSYILYGRISSSIYALCFAVFFGVLIYKIQSICRTPKLDKYGDWSVVSGLQATLCACGAVIVFVALLINIDISLMAWFAPKVWLLREIAGLLK